MSDDSWRNTLYIWDGIFIVTDDKKEEEEEDNDDDKELPASWEGTWVGVENVPDAKKAEAPRRVGAAKDVESSNTFSVSGTAKKCKEDKKEGDDDDDDDDDDSAPAGNPMQVSFTEGQGWDMGDGDDKKKYKDTVHQVLVSNVKWMGNVRDQRDNLVFAKGNNEFGNFIAAGWMRPGNRVTLARRYLDDEDGRVKWDLEQVKKSVISGIFDPKSGQVNIPPWQCDALHSEFQQPGKRKQAEESEEVKE